ncbi:MAG: PadR family transcriptional regulator [Alphaproteobacteria bacterium]|nr:PadR family transcriptional regulator [Alphaproteobacteria bacterium]
MNIRTLCLGILSFSDATGYEIKKMAEEGLFSHFVEASFGSIYPALTRMTDEGLLTCRSESQDGKPDKKVYSITDQGRTELKGALTIRPSKDKFKSEFLFIMLMSEHLDQNHVSAVLAQRARELEDELEMIRACGAQVTKPGGRFINGYGEAVIQAAHVYVSQNLDFSTTSEEPTGTQIDDPHLNVDAAE